MAQDKKSYLILIVILGVTIFNLYNMRQIKTDVEEFNQKIDSIQSDIDSIAIVNEELDSKIESLHSEIELIDGDINRVQNNIYTIRKNTDEQVNSVDAFTFSELQKFFANRYDSILKRTNSEISN